ncbi:uncharacterized protein KZ484_013787 [Pholidichthys leucotaenia]
MTDRIPESLPNLKALRHIKQRHLSDREHSGAELQRKSQAVYRTHTRTMAPVAMVGELSGFMPPVGIIFGIIAFLVLSVTMQTLCAQCKKNDAAYNVNETKTATVDSNGTADTGTSTWRNHNNMPPLTLDRPKAQTH